MGVFYKEITTGNEIEQCVNLQKTVFGLSDTEVISPHLLHLISRNNPPIGISVGAYITNDDSVKLIGYLIGFASHPENSIYTVLMGIDPKYQNNIYGHKLALKSRDIAIEKGFSSMSCAFDPFDHRLARLYISRLGFKGLHFIKNKNDLPTEENPNLIPIGSFLAKWDFHSTNSSDCFDDIKKNKIENLLNCYPIISKDIFRDSDKLLVEIPSLQTNDDYNYTERKINAQNILIEYINNRHYYVSDCYSIKVENKRKSYYLLEKQ
jgi:predicted GNAT superfamily acetyltransferase